MFGRQKVSKAVIWSLLVRKKRQGSHKQDKIKVCECVRVRVCVCVCVCVCVHCTSKRERMGQLRMSVILVSAVVVIVVAINVSRFSWSDHIRVLLLPDVQSISLDFVSHFDWIHVTSLEFVIVDFLAWEEIAEKCLGSVLCRPCLWFKSIWEMKLSKLIVLSKMVSKTIILIQSNSFFYFPTPHWLSIIWSIKEDDQAPAIINLPWLWHQFHLALDWTVIEPTTFRLWAECSTARP